MKLDPSASHRYGEIKDVLKIQGLFHCKMSAVGWGGVSVRPREGSVLGAQNDPEARAWSRDFSQELSSLTCLSVDQGLFGAEVRVGSRWGQAGFSPPPPFITLPLCPASSMDMGAAWPRGRWSPLLCLLCSVLLPLNTEAAATRQQVAPDLSQASGMTGGGQGVLDSGELATGGPQHSVGGVHGRFEGRWAGPAPVATPPVLSGSTQAGSPGDDISRGESASPLFRKHLLDRRRP